MSTKKPGEAGSNPFAAWMENNPFAAAAANNPFAAGSAGNPFAGGGKAGNQPVCGGP